jgi:exodeoxyribonuclease V alpha subunit
MSTDTLFVADDADFSGTVSVLGVLFSSVDDGYAVLEVQDTDSGEGFAVIGPVAHLNAGDRAEVLGDWQTHSRYGRQLRATQALPLDPPDRKGQISYLSSLPHIGPSRAESLVDEYWPSVLETIAQDPTGIFNTLRGVSEKQAEETAKSWHSSRAIRDLHIQLAPHGLAYLAAPVHNRFGDEAITVLRDDPYRLTEVEGIGFIRADRIALSAGIARDSDRRAHAAAVYTVAEAEQQGHTYLPLPELAHRTSKLIGRDPDHDTLAGTPRLLLDEGRAYRELTHASELAVAETLRKRAVAPPFLDHDPGDDGEADTELTPEQWAAVGGAFRSRISVITGGPGVGKTVCTRAIVAEALASGATIALCAPTGRAARRLEEATKHEAHTIHRMLEWSPGRKPTYGSEHPLPVDMVIVDEASMLNLRLMEVLLAGLAESTHIVFVGDVDQLPPIGAGKPFEDLIESGVAPVVRLNQIFRQAARSMITTAAHEINSGRRPRLRPEGDQEQDFFFIDRPDAEHALKTIIDVVARRAPERFAVDPIRDVQVLAPMYKGTVGIDALNERLQQRLNPDGKPAMRNRFRIGDRLIQTRNSPELGLMNGSIVFLRADDPAEEEVIVEADDGGTLLMSYSEADSLRVAYAISVHKAQGCEVPIIVTACHRSHARMLTRSLLYTAITRARTSCVVVGDPGALAMSVRRDDGSRRYSGLAERIAANGSS